MSTPLRDVEKGTPIWYVQQLWSGARTLSVSVKNQSVLIARKGNTLTVMIAKNGKQKSAETYDWNDKDHRRIILHRVWRWQKRAKWRIGK